MSAARTTDDTFTHVWPLSGGYTLTFRADHGALYCDVEHAKSRYPSTSRVSEPEAQERIRRLIEIVRNIPLSRAA